MATLKQRVHRMNESGSYDTIYYETSSEVVIRPDGTTVESAINSIAETSGNPANLWVWNKFNYTPASYHDGETHTNETMVQQGTYDSEVTFYYSDSISVDELGTVSLINPSTLDLSYSNYSSASVLKGKYIRKPFSSQVAFIPTTATFSRKTSNGHYLVIASTVKYIVGVAAVFSHAEYLSSPNSSTYPEDSQSGDYWYTRLGQIGEGMTKGEGMAKIETGSYVGTGTDGSSNPNSLTFGFVPKLVMVRNAGLYRQYFLDAVKGVGNTTSDYDYGTSQTTLVWSDNTLSWYSQSGANQQMNGNNQLYFYIAIG